MLLAQALHLALAYVVQLRVARHVRRRHKHRGLVHVEGQVQIARAVAARRALLEALVRERAVLDRAAHRGRGRGRGRGRLVGQGGRLARLLVARDAPHPARARPPLPPPARRHAHSRIGARRGVAAGRALDGRPAVAVLVLVLALLVLLLRIVALEIVHGQSHARMRARLPEGLRSAVAVAVAVAVAGVVQSSFVARILDHEPLKLVVALERREARHGRARVLFLHVLFHVEISISRPGRRRRGGVDIAAMGVARARDLGRQRGDGLEGPARAH